MERITGRCHSIFHGLGRLARIKRAAEGAARRNEVRVLAILPPGPNRLLIEALSREAGWALTIADAPSAVVLVDLSPIIIYERELSPYTWRETIRALTRSSPRPYVILLSPTSDKNLWDELERVGGSDILRTPVEREDALRAVSRAWSLWRIQQRVRLAASPPGGLITR